jgi:glyoxylase-like metal-dependent hydrolase (beta-lactamase superfamily II)
MVDGWVVDALLEGNAYSSACTLVTRGSFHLLVDTGLSIEERALVRALAARGLVPDDIDAIINTHLHLDHCGNNALFSRAVIFLSLEEWRWTDAFYNAIFNSRSPEQTALEFYAELPSYGLTPRIIRNIARLVRLFWKRDRLGREEQFRWIERSLLPEGLELVPTPGHTPFHVSVRVPGPVPVIIAGDAVLAEDPEARVRTMIPFSRAQFVATRHALLQRGDRIIPGHGPAFEGKKYA